MVDGAADGVADGAGLLADDDAQHVELFGDTYGAAVAQAEVGVDVEARGDGQYAACRQQLAAVGYDRPVVQGRVLEEQGFYQGAGSQGVDALAGVDEFVHRVLPFEDYQGAGLALRHVHAGVDIGLV